VRLEDWQKYIESQFLDDDVEEEKTEAAPAPQMPADQGVLPLEPTAETAEAAAQTPPDAERKTDEAEDVPVFRAVEAAPAMEDAPDIPAMRAESAPVRPAAPEESRADLPTFIVPAAIETTDGGAADIPLFNVSKTPREAPPSPARPARYAARGSEAETSFPTFGPVPDVDTDIPVFSHYLPSTHDAVKTNAPAAPVPASADSPTRSLSGVKPPVEPRETSQATPPAAGKTPRETPPRRVPKHRAPHARNVRPENVPSGLSATELWAKVPRHVQTLLALERMEEQETAQSSYKRPFQEKRHELIERILDPILSLEDTARLLNVCPTTVRRYTNKGILTHYRKEPERSTRSTARPDKETRQRRFRLSDILAFLETQQAAIEADRRAERRAARTSAPSASAKTAGSSDSEETPGGLFAP